MIYVDETLPVGDFEPQFPHRHVTIKRCRDVHAQYEMLDEIGRGKFGRVMKCRHREENEDVYYAAKFVLCLKREDRRNVEREVEIMNKLSDTKLLYLYDAYDNGRNELCLITEYIGGGELFDRVIEDEFVLTEKACAAFMRQIVEAVSYIHQNHIIHLDLKPENIMCLTKTGNRIKIIDFGLARIYESHNKLQVLFGTPEFVAPEVVAFEPISFATDMWAVGVICYVLLSGLSPFMGDTDLETMANVTIAEYDYEDEAFNNISQQAKNFIDKLLVKEKEKRSTASQCLQHPWLNQTTQPNQNEKPEQQIAGKQNLTHQRDKKTEEQNYVFDSNSKTMCFASSNKNNDNNLAGGQPNKIVEVEFDEEMSDVDCRKRSGEKDVSTESIIQRKRSKTPSDECDVISSPSVLRPVITLDQVKHKADEILEGRRNSMHSDLSDHHNANSSQCGANLLQCDENATKCDENKFNLSVVDETLWQAAERTLTPMWEIATTGNESVTQRSSREPRTVISPTYSSDGGSSFQHHDTVSGCDVTSVSPLPSVPLESNEHSKNGNSAKVVRQTSCHVDARQVSPFWEENSVQEFTSDDLNQPEVVKTIEDFKSPTVPWNETSDWSSSSKESQNKFWGLDEEFGDSESLLDELHDLMDCKNWCSSSKSSATTPTKSMTSTPTFTPIPRSSKVGASPMSSLMKEVNEQIRFTPDFDSTLQPPQPHQQPQQPIHRPVANVRASLDRFVGVRDDILQMKNELNALKKDLSSAKRGLESDKKPLMDIMNRLDPPRAQNRDSATTSYTNTGRSSSARDMLDTQEALEDLKKTMTDFNYCSSSQSAKESSDSSDNPLQIRKVFKSANTGSVNQFKSRFEQKTSSVQEVRQEPVSRLLNPRNKSVTPFRNATKSPSPVSPAPPPLPPSIRRRSPSPVFTGNVSRVRNRFESSGGTSVSSRPRGPLTTTTNTCQPSAHQTLPKTFKLREALTPITNGESRLQSPTNHDFRYNKFGGSVAHLHDSSSRLSPRFTGSAFTKPANPCSPPPPKTKGLFERQASVPNAIPSQNRFMPRRQMSHDLVQGAATFLSQALPVNGATAKGQVQSRTKVKGPFGYTDL